MKSSPLPLVSALTRAFAGLALIGAAGLVAAQTTPPPPVTNPPPPATATVPNAKLVSTFASFAGSEENSASLVNGLRTSSPITLTGLAPGPTPHSPPVVETTTFVPPTRPMGYGNVRIAMSLAEAQLASQGITQPTPRQLQGALMGTTTVTGHHATTTQGVLQMRASGMGWGQISNSMGVKLGAVMSGKQTFTHAVPAGSTASTASTAHGKSGVTTASGSHAGKSSITTASGSSAGKSGVTTAGGGAASGNSGVTTAAGSGGGNAYGHGKSSVVTASGGGAGAVATGLGHGNGGGASARVVSASGGAGGQGGGHGGGQGGGKH